MTDQPLIPVLLGETASGKTSVGIDLALRINGEVISVDSRKVYQGLPVGTATPRGEWKEGLFFVKGIAHHLIGHLRPNEPYTAGDFVKDAERLIPEIMGRGKIPILVGGTGFYFKALQQGLPVLPPRNESVRRELTRRLESEGISALYDELAKIDPIAASRITSKDKHKIIRALEVIRETGQPFSEWKNHRRAPASLRFAVMGLRYSKELINKRIEERSRRMAKDGMIEETENVLKQGYSPHCPALASFGYREAVDVVQGRLSREEFLPKLIHGTKAYAKRQRTWFRTQVQPTWFLCEESTPPSEISMKMKAFLENYSI